MEATPARVRNALRHEKSLALRMARMFSKWSVCRRTVDDTEFPESTRLMELPRSTDLDSGNGTMVAREGGLLRDDTDPERTWMDLLSIARVHPSILIDTAIWTTIYHDRHSFATTAAAVDAKQLAHNMSEHDSPQAAKRLAHLGLLAQPNCPDNRSFSIIAANARSHAQHCDTGQILPF
jgi:hypothetical protein